MSSPEDRISRRREARELPHQATSSGTSRPRFRGSGRAVLYSSDTNMGRLQRAAETAMRWENRTDLPTERTLQFLEEVRQRGISESESFRRDYMNLHSIPDAQIQGQRGSDNSGSAIPTQRGYLDFPSAPTIPPERVEELNRWLDGVHSDTAQNPQLLVYGEHRNKLVHNLNIAKREEPEEFKHILRYIERKASIDESWRPIENVADFVKSSG
jgi:hypothetical protein